MVLAQPPSKRAIETRKTRLWAYNNERPNMGLGGITPKQKLAMMA